jgi:ribosomal protein L16 Arg81 hydroxylase
MLDLDALLMPVESSTFLQCYLGRKMLHIPGHRSKVAGLCSWRDINGLLGLDTIAVSHVKLVKETNVIAQEAYTATEAKSGARRIRPAEMTKHLREGATLVVYAFDELRDSVSQLARRIESRVEVPVGVNLYACWRPTRGLALHWDDHDVLIVPISGRKHWRVYPPTDLFPVEKFSEKTSRLPETEAAWEGYLEPGDILYFPRGWWHIATPTEDPTAHLTFGFTRATGIDLCRWLVGRLTSRACLRTDVPIFEDEIAQDEFLSALRGALVESFDTRLLVEQFRADQNVLAPGRPLFGLPWSATAYQVPDDDGCLITLAINRRLEMRHRVETSMLEVSVRGRTLSFHEDTRALFDCLSQKGPVSIGAFYREFADRFSRDEMHQFLVNLAMQGIAVFQDAVD